MSKLLKIAIAIDRWKLSIFEEVLKKKGYEYTVLPGLTPDMLTITLMTVDAGLMKSAVAEAQKQCKKQRKSKMQ